MTTSEEIEKYRDLIAAHDAKIVDWVEEIADTIAQQPALWALAEKYLVSPDRDDEVSMFLRAAKGTVSIEKDGSICITDDTAGREYNYIPKSGYGDPETVGTTIQRVVDAMNTWAKENNIGVEAGQRVYTFTVEVTTDTVTHAHQVIAERLSYDEELTDELGQRFDYSISPARLVFHTTR